MTCPRCGNKLKQGFDGFVSECDSCIDEQTFNKGPNPNPHVIERINIIKEAIEGTQRYMAANQPNERAKRLLQDAYMLVGRARMVVSGTPVFLCDGADIEVNP